eukprot:3145737-Prymnesium_polylepis.1
MASSKQEPPKAGKTSRTARNKDSADADGGDAPRTPEPKPKKKKASSSGKKKTDRASVRDEETDQVMRLPLRASR